MSQFVKELQQLRQECLTKPFVDAENSSTFYEFMQKLQSWELGYSVFMTGYSTIAFNKYPAQVHTVVDWKRTRIAIITVVTFWSDNHDFCEVILITAPDFQTPYQENEIWLFEQMVRNTP